MAVDDLQFDCMSLLPDQASLDLSGEEVAPDGIIESFAPARLTSAIIKSHQRSNGTNLLIKSRRQC